MGKNSVYRCADYKEVFIPPYESILYLKAAKPHISLSFYLLIKEDKEKIIVFCFKKYLSWDSANIIF